MSKAYEVTATRRRPKDFSSMKGQEFVSSAISNSINNGQIAHSYIFSGPRGTGKTSSARILAKSINCLNSPSPTITPCGTCSNCTEITTGNSLDVIEIDGASNTGVNDIRNIKDEILFPPTSSRYKIYIIDEVHMLSTSAFNALLKTIEEPPAYIIFIFATTEIHKIPATVKSRCQMFNFRLIDLNLVKEALREASKELNIEADDDALFWIAKEGGGSMRDAYTLFDQVVAFCNGHLTLAKIRDKIGLSSLEELNSLVLACVEQNVSVALANIHTMLSAGVSVEQILIDLAEYFRAIVYIKNGITKESILGYSVQSFNQTVINTFTTGQIEVALDAIFKLYKELRLSLNSTFELELLINKLCRLKYFINNTDLIEQIHDLKKALGALPTEVVAVNSDPLSSTTNHSDTKQAIKTNAAMPEVAKEQEVIEEEKSTLINDIFN